MSSMFDEVFVDKKIDTKDVYDAYYAEIYPKIAKVHGEGTATTQTLAGLAARNIAMNPVKGTDVMKNGYAVCGECGEKRQEYIAKYDLVFHQPCSCDRKHEKKASAKSETMSFIDTLIAEKVMDRSTLDVSLATDNMKNPIVRAEVDKYLKNWEMVRRDNIGIMFFGDVGTGKSYYAHAISAYLREKGILTVNTTASAIIDTFPAQYSYLKKAELLVIDDVGTERSTSYGYEKLFSALDTRYKAKLPTIITTNYSPFDMLNEALPTKRVFDRIGEMCALAIEFKGESMRTQVGEQKAGLFKEASA